MAELVPVIALVIAGAGLAHGLGIRPVAAVLAVSLPLAIFTYVAFGAVLIMLGIPAYPAVGLGLVVVVGVLSAVRGGRPMMSGREVAVGVALLLGIVAATLILVRVNLVSFTPDSFRYLTTAALLADHGNLDRASGSLVLSRGFAIPYIHALGWFSGKDFLVSITPLVAFAGGASLAWLAWLGWRDASGRVSPLGWGMILAGGAAIASMHRFGFSATYIHTHMLFAVAMLFAGGMAWTLLSSDEMTEAATPVIFLSLATLILVRPEGVLVAGLLLLPVVASSRVPVRSRVVLATTFGLFTAAWNWRGIGARYLDVGASLPTDVWGIVLAGLLIAAAGLVLWWRPTLLPRQGVVLTVAHGALWAMLAAFVARDREIFINSVVPTWENITSSGLWGSSLFLLVGLCLLVAFRSRGEALSALWFPIASLVPLVFVLAYLRGGGYRVGPGDSLNRMLIHIVLLAGLWIIVASKPPVRPRAALASATQSDYRFDLME